MASERPNRNPRRRLQRTALLARPTPLTRTSPPVRRTPLRRSTSLEPSGPAAASAAQRLKVDGLTCLVCGARRAIDPAHLVPRSLGGCDEADCVVPLCRRHHRAYDGGELDLLPYLEPARRAEICHAVTHLGLIGALRRLTGRRDVV
jgi:5-methylcytosine-specific restriction endonuclease McrA